MITCEFCGTQAEQHDHWRHEIMARVAALEDVVTREPTAEAPKRCPHGVPSHLGCWNCTSHAVKVGDVVMDEPPAEQPSRQETGGDCGVPGCRACTAMRDRAKAKAAEPSGTGQLPGGDLNWSPHHFNCAAHKGGLCTCSIAEPPAPAAGTLSERLRFAEALVFKAQIASLETRLAQAERDRDERGRQVEQMAEHVSTMRTERDEATARERERCLAWVRHFNPMSTAAGHAIKGGAPAPKCDPGPPRDSHWDRPFMVEVCPHGCSEPSDCDICTPELLDHPRAEVFSEGPPTRSPADILRDPPKLNLSPPRDVAPDRTQAEDCARCPVCRWPLAETVDKGCVPGNCSYRPRERGNP